MRSTTTTTTAAMPWLVAVMAVAAAVTFRGGVFHFHQDMGTNHTQQRGFKPHHRDRGYLGNCAGGFYNVSWFPKDITPQDRIQFSANLVAPVDLDVFHVFGVLHYEGQKVLTINTKYSCWELVQQAQGMFPHYHDLRFDCPFRKGQLLSGSFLFTDTESLIGGDGTYYVKVTVADMKGRELLCVDITVEVLPFPDY